jgi:hypothetical protein
VGVFKIDRINAGKRDELFEIDAPVRLSFKAFEFLFGDGYVLVFSVLEAAHETVSLYNDLTHGAVVLIADS